MPSPGGLLALDLSLSTGHAYGVFGERPIWGCWKLGKIADGGKVYARLEDHIDDAIRLHRPRAVIYEAPLPPNRQPQESIGKLLLGLCAIVELISTRHDLPCFHQNIRESRTKVLGKCPAGGADKIKPVIISWARSRGWEVGAGSGNDDAADALLLLQHGTVVMDRTGKAHYFRNGEVL